MNSSEPGEVGVPQVCGLSVTDTELTGQSEGGQTVGQAVAHGFDMASLLGGDVVDIDAMDQGGDVAV